MTSKVVLTNVQVLAAGTKIERDTDKDKPMPVSVVTLLVNPEEAERLTLASTEGKIQLALRNPLDKTMPATRGIRPAALLGFGAPTRIGVATRASMARRRRPAPSSPHVAPSRRRSKSSAETNAHTKSCGRSSEHAYHIRVVIRRSSSRSLSPCRAVLSPTTRRPVTAARRPLDGHRRRHADRARVADQRRHRRRARHLAEPAADQRQDARHDLDVRLGARRRAAPLRSRRPARSRRGSTSR